MMIDGIEVGEKQLQKLWYYHYEPSKSRNSRHMISEGSVEIRLDDFIFLINPTEKAILSCRRL